LQNFTLFFEKLCCAFLCISSVAQLRVPRLLGRDSILEPTLRQADKLTSLVTPRVSFETSFDSKQPILEPKLVSALSETKCLFRLFRFYTETESFGVSIEPKQRGDQQKQFDREHIMVFFLKILCCFGLFRFVSVCFETVWFGCFEFYTETASFDVE
jgi:hypothetical protein